MSASTCPICGSTSVVDVGVVPGAVIDRQFQLCRCTSCQFVFVSNPSLEYDALYSEEYYNGKGADTKLNYVGEVQQPTRTVRRYEWRGVLERVSDLTPLPGRPTWLDYGCGTGGLVTYLRARGVDAFGFEQGWCEDLLRRNGVPTIEQDEFALHAGRFDVVSAIEVIEHTTDPVAVLRTIRPLLKPGGLLFMTTGNAQPFHDRITNWRYVTPDVHISYFEPATLAAALEAAGFSPAFPGFGPGWEDIIRFKLLMSLRRKWTSPLEAIVPWRPLARLVDSRLKLSAQPVGWAKD
jgi:2-polyprenyl-3-methyl-5-hydroxy-6-metoxy-1,4-benzoquinol methylase